MCTTPPQTWQLHQWLLRIDEGDLAAREELFRSVGDRLERLARKMLDRFASVRRWADTGDILQNALVRLLRALREVRPESMRAFYGLAAEQMRRELLDLARHFAAAARADHPLPNDSQLATSGAVAGEGDPGELELWQHFHQAVRELPAPEREVMSLTYYHGWSQAQIAELFQVDERTIRRRWRAACLQLQTRLNGQFPGGASWGAVPPRATPHD
jgi:RNA polymerase sigma-70 factor (ECF subfamily)